MAEYSAKARKIDAVNRRLAILDAKKSYLERKMVEACYYKEEYELCQKRELEDFEPRYAEFRKTLCPRDQELVREYEVALVCHLREKGFEHLRAKYPGFAPPDDRPPWMRISIEERRKQTRSLDEFWARQTVVYMLMESMKREIKRGL